MCATNLGRWAALAVAAAVALAAVRAAEPTRAVEDLLPVDSQWKGKLTQSGKTPANQLFPSELETVLTVTLRSGDAFEAELHESADNLDITYLVRGTVVHGPDKALVIRFRSHAVKGVPNAGAYFLNVPYTARFTGDTLKGTWSYEDKEDEIALDGTFQLKRNDE
jgi:hypothetical protein